MTTVTVVGDGESNRRNTNALLKDFVDGFAAETTFVIPVTAPWFTDAVRHVADWVFEHQSTFVTLAFIADGHDLVDLADYEGIPIREVDDVAETLQESDQIIAAWPLVEDVEFESWIEDALKSGKKVYDLTDGLYPIEYTPDEPGDEAAKVEEPVVVEEPKQGEVEPTPEKPKATRSRAARNAAKTQDAAADEAQATIPPQPVAEIDAEAVAQRAAEIVLERLRTAIG